MKLNLNKPFVDQSGSALDSELDLPMDKFLSRALGVHNGGDPVKLWDWAVSLFKNGEIDIDKSDKEVLLTFVRENKSFNNLVKAQLIEEISALGDPKIVQP